MGDALRFCLLVELMDAQFWALTFAVLGFCLIAAEFFIPSGGMIALSCAGCFVASVVCAHTAWYRSSPGVFWSFSLGLGVLIPTFLTFFLRLLERTSLGNQLLLPRTVPEDVVPYSSEAAVLDRLIGRVGTALTPMNPGGLVRVENERLHAVCEELMLSLGEPVEVTGIRGNRVVVRRAKAQPLAPPPDSQPGGEIALTSVPPPAKSEGPTEPESLDFDVPQD